MHRSSFELLLCSDVVCTIMASADQGGEKNRRLKNFGCIINGLALKINIASNVCSANDERYDT